MNRHDLAPGQRLFRFRHDDHTAGRCTTCELEPGDVMVEEGPRIGERFWQVVATEDCPKLLHAALRPITRDEYELSDGYTRWAIT